MLWVAMAFSPELRSRQPVRVSEIPPLLDLRALGRLLALHGARTSSWAPAEPLQCWLEGRGQQSGSSPFFKDAKAEIRALASVLPQQC